MNTKSKTLAVLMVSIIAISVVAMAVPAMADGDPVDPVTKAVISGSGSPPIIDYKFELPDDADPTHVTPGTQVKPVPDGTKIVSKYVVVWDPNGASDITRVRVRTYYPNGTPKDESDAVELSYAEVVAVTNDAFAQNLITAAEREDIQSRCYDGQARMFKEENIMSCCDPAGDYKVVAEANDQSGSWSAPFENTFKYISIRALKIDFRTVDYGVIVPCIEQIVSGDTDLMTHTKPTIRNQANDPFKLRIIATDMIGSDPSNVIPADSLDARVYNNTMDQKLLLNTTATLFDPIIEPCTNQKIDFSIHAPTGTCGDTYTGKVYLWPVAP